MKQYLLCGLLLFLCGCNAPSEADDAKGLDFVVPDLLDPLQIDVQPVLHEHGKEFKRQIIKVTERVYVAVGYAAGNSILIVGDGGNIVVDTTENPNIARKLRTEFDRISPQPLTGLIYTHNHGDHTFGAGGMVGSDKPQILAHSTTTQLVRRVLGILNPVLSRRSARMFGSTLNGPALENIGIGAALLLDPNRNVQFLPPTKTFDKTLDVTISGVRLELVHAPGETDDHIYIYLPDEGVLLCGDNFYRAFPNLYTIRGTPYRDLDAWINSLDSMLEREPEHIVPSHSRPLSGKEFIAKEVSRYRDGIQYVHDQSVRLINAGASPQELLKLQLPPELAESNWLQPLYGKPGWSALAVYNGYLGWFDGNPSQLQPATTSELATRWVRLAGGVDNLVREAHLAWRRGEYQWLLHLSDVVLSVAPEHPTVKVLRHNALVKLGAQSVNPNQRHYYLVSAQQLSNPPPQGSLISREVLDRISLEDLFRIMRVRLNPEVAGGVNIGLRLKVEPAGKTYDLIVRNSVLIVRTGEVLEKPDLIMSASATNFKQVFGGIKNPIAAITVSNDLRIESGSRFILIDFLNLFSGS